MYKCKHTATVGLSVPNVSLLRPCKVCLTRIWWQLLCHNEDRSEKPPRNVRKIMHKREIDSPMFLLCSGHISMPPRPFFRPSMTHQENVLPQCPGIATTSLYCFALILGTETYSRPWLLAAVAQRNPLSKEMNVVFGGDFCGERNAKTQLRTSPVFLHKWWLLRVSKDDEWVNRNIIRSVRIRRADCRQTDTGPPTTAIISEWSLLFGLDLFAPRIILGYRSASSKKGGGGKGNIKCPSKTS